MKSIIAFATFFAAINALAITPMRMEQPELQERNSHIGKVDSAPTVDETIVRGEWAVTDDSNARQKSQDTESAVSNLGNGENPGKVTDGTRTNRKFIDAMDLRSGWNSEDRNSNNWVPSGPESLNIDTLISNQDARL
ncbi:hypothetical protein QBC41DRAFT_299545 [Cercophora samala]|uniref:Uncharacterized protein n=1 Tax=Cercophora samala TaxID=330535 RepID=A0AA40DF29_9PEZI|nr:hypothetical protein QBC41DRAFT_299545 [Cercophora samala]